MADEAIFDVPLSVITGSGWFPAVDALDLTVPLPVVTGEGTGHGGSLEETVPLITLTMATGENFEVEALLPTLSATASQPNLANGSFEVPIVSLTTRTGGVASNTLPVPVLSIHGLSGTVGSAAIRVPVATLSATGNAPTVANGSFSVPIVRITGQASFVNQAVGAITVPRIDIDASGIVGVIGQAGIEVPLAQLTATATFAPSGSASITVPLILLEARASGAISVVSQVEESESETFALSVNLSNRAVSEYINYKFNSQTYFNGKYIGANTSGLFDLTGDDDAGTDIAAKIRTGLDDLGSYNLKRVWGIYLAHNAEAIRIKTISESGDFDAVGGAKNRATVSVQKFKSQRTKRGNYWGIEVSNIGGSDFEIGGLELICEVLNRRAV